jgi:hypothetical protein
MKSKNKTRKKTRDIHDKQFIILDVDPFDVNVGIAVNMTEKEILSEIRKTGCPEDLITKMMDPTSPATLADYDKDIQYKGRMAQLGGGFIVALRLRRNEFRKNLSILVHELTHVSHYLLRDRRIPLTVDTEEVYTYLLEDMMYKAMMRLY